MRGLYVNLLVTTVSYARTTEPIEMSSWTRTWVGLRNRILGGGPDHPGEVAVFRVGTFPDLL